MNIFSSHICCYCFHYSYSWLFLNIILDTQFSLRLYLKPFLSLQIPHKIRFKSKLHQREDENTSEDEEELEESLLFIKKDRKSYSLLMFSLIFILLVTKHYSTYTVFTAFVSKTVFSYKFLIKSDSSRKYKKEETKNVGRRGITRRVPSVHPKGPFVVLAREFNSIC